MGEPSNSISPSSAVPREGLGHRSAVAFSWGALASIAKVLMTLLVQAALARLLGPNDFGLFALGILIMSVASYFADVGLATSLVQRQTITDADIRFVLTINLITSLVVGAIVIGLSGPLAHAFGKSDMQAIFCSLAPVFLLNAIRRVGPAKRRPTAAKKMVGHPIIVCVPGGAKRPVIS